MKKYRKGANVRKEFEAGSPTLRLLLLWAGDPGFRSLWHLQRSGCPSFAHFAKGGSRVPSPSASLRAGSDGTRFRLTLFSPHLRAGLVNAVALRLDALPGAAFPMGIPTQAKRPIEWAAASLGDRESKSPP